MSWSLAKSLVKLKDQANAAAPTRSKASDGGIGNEEHAGRGKGSDHNPWVVRRDGSGAVRAYDFTHDPKGGFDAYVFAEALRQAKDPRLGYIISNRKISNPKVQGGAWRPYTQPNPHTHHTHVSVVEEEVLFDNTDPWKLPTFAVDPHAPPHLGDAHPLLLPGATGDHVRILQDLLLKSEAGSYGPITEAAVRAFQRKSGLNSDGKVGVYTWDALLSKKSTGV